MICSERKFTFRGGIIVLLGEVIPEGSLAVKGPLLIFCLRSQASQLAITSPTSRGVYRKCLKPCKFKVAPVWLKIPTTEFKMSVVKGLL